jgi:hypothetical protein
MRIFLAFSFLPGTVAWDDRNKSCPPCGFRGFIIISRPGCRMNNPDKKIPGGSVRVFQVIENFCHPEEHTITMLLVNRAL